MKRRTNSVISSLYRPIGDSRYKTAACMFAGGLVLVCLGVGLIVTTCSARRRHPSTAPGHADETSVLISGPTCLALGTVVAVLGGTDLCRYRRAKNSVESELDKVVSGYGAAGKGAEPPAPLPDPQVSVIVDHSTWAS